MVALVITHDNFVTRENHVGQQAMAVRFKHVEQRKPALAALDMLLVELLLLHTYER